MQISHYLPRALPQSIQELATLALDLRWNWHHGADDLWRLVDPDLWEATANPWLILETISDQRLNQLAADPKFVRALQQQVLSYEQQYNEESWVSAQDGSRFKGQVAYFSMEFGLSESLPIYSGGLGVLAGDLIKTACDLDLPLIGIGLLYQRGYFRQILDAHGEQLEFYPVNDPTMLPVVPLRDDQGEWVHINLELPGRSLRLRTWLAQAGRRTLLLLDSNDLLNDPSDRGITSELYGGGLEMRLQQEMVLGIGGWRLLERLGLDCPVCHLNEGHAAFAILERACHFMEREKQDFPTALCVTRAGNLFTTHTPVSAGFDRFAPELFALYFQSYAQSLGIELETLLALGRRNPDDRSEPFNMAYLAVRGAGAINGVSHLHREVSRRIFQPLFPRWPQQEVPVGHITNGVHVPSWDSEAADALWTQACGKDRWRGGLENVEANLLQLSDEALWRFRCAGRQQLVAFLRERLVRQHGSRGTDEAKLRQCADELDPDIMTLGFARRFAEYKRTNLLLQDPQRLIRLLTHRDHPVQLVIAGKAHPKDLVGKQLVRQWQTFLERVEVAGRVVFVEDYDLTVAGHLVQGVDVWLNTPRRPWEASGTSGMKVLVNGGLNVSELDGWWAEAFSSEVGWALGDGCEHKDIVAWDRAEAEQLFGLLESEVIPCFYRRSESGIPVDWINRMRESMAHLTSQFSSNRMLREYDEVYYRPLAEGFRNRTIAVAKSVLEWKKQLSSHWQHIHFGNITSNETENAFQFEVQVYLDELVPEAVQVQLYADALDGSDPQCWNLQRGALLTGSVNAYVYKGTVPKGRPSSHYTPRIIPANASACIPLEANYILWYR